MRLSKWLLLVLGACLIQSVVAPRYLPGAFRPELLLVMAMFLTIRAPAEEVLPLCWLTGLARDMLSAGPPGAYALIYLIVGLALLRMRPSLNVRFIPVEAALGFVVCLAVESAYFAAACLRGGMAPPPGTVRALLIMSLATACLTPICFRALDRLRGWLGMQRRHSLGSI